MKKTILSMMLVLVCLAFAFSGCGGEEAEKCPATAEKPAVAPAAAPAAPAVAPAPATAPKPAAAPAPAPAVAPAKTEVVTRELPVYNVSDSSWDWGRSGYHDEFGNFAHYYGGDTDGFFAYEFEGAANVTAVQIKARMSAEADNYVEPSETSDVTVYINDVKVATTNVMNDDFKGKIYTWDSTDAAVLKVIKSGAGNILKFAVEKDAQNKHGLCIYGEAIEEAEKANAIPVIVKLTVTK